ncbi:hypothetical protein H6F93_09080 [Leptolyngbya sp. FACHB-671]|uniref:hypothetical protein n=1 Tax=Leptolyngbya sp. FACHB-671 TaxID=2692812 RepID=UPI001686D481|nr:hypothetical protein [Leptolyngbya sp. FACHB-671]MBD2067681.1 hypothetical protein [Leptolyngbya sp. FACHB-671]
MRLTPREKAEKALAAVFDPVDVIGRAVMGDLWKTLCESIQDAVALSLLLQIPSLIGRWILGKEFSGFDACMHENPFGVNRYACFIIVASDFCLWIVLAGRVISRFLADLNQLLAKKGGGRAGNP